MADVKCLYCDYSTCFVFKLANHMIDEHFGPHVILEDGRKLIASEPYNKAMSLAHGEFNKAEKGAV